MQEKPLIDYLENSTKNTLINKMRIAGLKYSGLDKPAIVAKLEEFLQGDQNIRKIWDSLSPFEKEYLEEFLKYEEMPSYEKIKYLYQKHGKQESPYRDPWDERSKLGFFFIGRSVPSPIKKRLTRYLTPIVIKYNNLEELPEADKHRFNCIGESFAEDFCNVISLANSTKLALTKAKQVPTKSAVLKINNALITKDFVLGYFGGIADIRSIDDANRIYGISMLLMAADLLVGTNNTLYVSHNGAQFLRLNLVDQCKYLLKHYLESSEIHEIKRIVESNYKTEHDGNMTECRNVIIKHLKNCPVGVWVSSSQLLDYIKIKDKNFLLNQVGYISCFSEKFREYLEPWVEWEQVEGRFIEVVLQEYLSVLGIVDTVIYESEGGSSDYDQFPFFKVDYFRITPMGAFVLNMSNDYSIDHQTISHLKDGVGKINALVPDTNLMLQMKIPLQEG